MKSLILSHEFETPRTKRCRNVMGELASVELTVLYDDIYLREKEIEELFASFCQVLQKRLHGSIANKCLARLEKADEWNGLSIAKATAKLALAVLACNRLVQKEIENTFNGLATELNEVLGSRVQKLPKLGNVEVPALLVKAKGAAKVASSLYKVGSNAVKGMAFPPKFGTALKELTDLVETIQGILANLPKAQAKASKELINLEGNLQALKKLKDEAKTAGKVEKLLKSAAAAAIDPSSDLEKAIAVWGDKLILAQASATKLKKKHRGLIADIDKADDVGLGTLHKDLISQEAEIEDLLDQIDSTTLMYRSTVAAHVGLRKAYGQEKSTADKKKVLLEKKAKKFVQQAKEAFKLDAPVAALKYEKETYKNDYELRAVIDLG